ncbi:hypothetical protein ACLB2K_072302 [Fragaria x ananassa]
MWAWLEDKTGTIYRDWKGDSRHYKKYGRETILPDLIHRQDEWDWLCWHFESPDFKTRSAANTTNRGLSIFKGGLPSFSVNFLWRWSPQDLLRVPGWNSGWVLTYRVVHHKEKDEEFPVIPAYTETYDTVNDPKAAKNLKEMQKEVSQLKTAQKNANPDIPETELPPLEWSMNIKVLEVGVGRKARQEIRGGRAGV